MPRLKISALLALLFVTLAMAVTPITMQMDGRNIISSSVKLDSLVSSTDTSTLRADWMPETGWEHFIVRDAFTGANADTAVFCYQVYCYNAAGALMYVVTGDSLRANVGGLTVLPIDNTACGFKYTLKIRGLAKIASKVYLNRFNLGKRK